MLRKISTSDHWLNLTLQDNLSFESDGATPPRHRSQNWGDDFWQISQNL
jgi:hypothetical protein